MTGARIYLASRSPRRRELLKQIGIGHEILMFRENPARPLDVDETPLPNEAPRDYVQRIARAKAVHGGYCVKQRMLPRLPVLAADTAVVLEERIFGKPAGRDGAIEMLNALSGRRHEVLTAVAVTSGERLEMRLSVSTVEFKALSMDEIRQYAASGEPLDKAGAYAVQGRAAAFIAHLCGSHSGVMGLPLFETAELLTEFGVGVLS